MWKTRRFPSGFRNGSPPEKTGVYGQKSPGCQIPAPPLFSHIPLPHRWHVRTARCGNGNWLAWRSLLFSYSILFLFIRQFPPENLQITDNRHIAPFLGIVGIRFPYISSRISSANSSRSSGTPCFRMPHLGQDRTVIRLRSFRRNCCWKFHSTMLSQIFFGVGG